MNRILLVQLLACVLGSAAEPPYAGKWKVNFEKSDLGQMTISYQALPDGSMKATADGQSYTFRFDGNDNMTPFGITIAWTAMDATSWQVTEKIKGQVVSKGTLKLSPDGNQLAAQGTRWNADGGTSAETAAFTRVAGGPGLAGQWRTRKMTSSAPEVMTLTPLGSDGVKLSFGNEGVACEAKFDGNAYPAQGPLFPPGWTCVVARHGTGGLSLTWKKDGKGMYQSTLEVSADGKTLKETGSAVAVPERTTVVYDRQ